MACLNPKPLTRLKVMNNTKYIIIALVEDWGTLSKIIVV
jgi:hypothetical protein